MCRYKFLCKGMGLWNPSTIFRVGFQGKAIIGRESMEAVEVAKKTNTVSVGSFIYEIQEGRIHIVQSSRLVYVANTN